MVSKTRYLKDMKRLLLGLVMVAGLVVLSITPANSVVKTGEVCTKLGQASIVSGKKYTCIKSRSKLIWNRGVVVKLAPKDTSSPTPRIVNELAGMVWVKKQNGMMNLSLVMQSLKSDYAFLADGLDYQTSYPDNFQPLDIWQDKIIACISSCNNSFFVSGLKDGNISSISLDKIKHPDIFSYSWFAGANFGSDPRYVYALTNFQPRDGVKSVVYRVDTASGALTPIFSTYCYSSTDKICAFGYTISGLRADHHSNKIYLSLELLWEGATSQTNTPRSFILSLNQDAPGITLKKSSEMKTRSNTMFDYAENAGVNWLVSEPDEMTTLNQMQTSPDGNTLYYVKTKGDILVALNELCKLNLVNTVSSCVNIAPFKYVSELTSLGNDSLLFSTLNFNTDEFGAEIYSFAKNLRIPVTNFSKDIWLQNFAVLG